MAEQNVGEFILGIDLGSNSLGWALIQKGSDGKPVGLLRTNGHPALGVRIFEAATEGDRESGKEKTRNLERRGARLARRQTLRRQRRMRNIFRLLQSYELLPACNSTDPIERQKRMNALDDEILSSPWFLQKYPVCSVPKRERTHEQSIEAHRLKQLLPYLLRAAALNDKLDPRFFGRALYHLAQHRGFESNRKGGEGKDEDKGPVKGDISKLRTSIGAGTLGEYFSRLTPGGLQDAEHIRGWHTHRDMYKDEFGRIWTAQAAHHPSLLTGERKAKIQTAIFFQRPTWFDPNTVGRCDLEPGERRAPMYLLSSQHFRVLETVNNLRVLPPGKPDFPLKPAQREELVSELDLKRKMSFDAIRKRLGLSKNDKFNLEPLKRKRRKGQNEAIDEADEDEKSGSASVKGNRTNAAFYDVFGERWLAMKPDERDRAVEYAFAFEHPEKLREASKKKWGLDDVAAEKLSNISFETRRAGISRKAMEKLRPLLEAGKTYAEARREAYHENFAPHVPLSKLPPVEFAAGPDRRGELQQWIEDSKALPPGAKAPEAMGEIRNPAVTRSLTELRKVVNDLVALHGKPAEIHIELLRELRNPKSARERIADANRENRAVRDRARNEIKSEIGQGYEPNDDEIRKVQLFAECSKVHCVYCGDPIPRKNFYGEGSDVHIDHIIPRSLSPDNTFQNLVLCHSHCNAEKGDRTPHQAFSGERYTNILNRVRQLQGKTARRKLRRFMMDDEELRKFLVMFKERQLRDSAYASKVAARYLGYLFGGVNDANRRQRIVCTSGEATAELRKAWGLFSILGDGPTAKGGAVKKSRHDHRHHAVDAVAVALTGEASIQELTRAKWGFPPGSRRRAALLQGPWPDFVGSVRTEVDRIVVSHRVSKKISGALHKETNYSPKEFGKSARRYRVLLTDLTEKKVMKDDVIADKWVRELVQGKLTGLGGGKPEELFNLPKNLPSFQTTDGRTIRIEKVRIQETIKTRQVGEGYRARFVRPGKNHSLEIYALVDPKDPERELGWDSEGVVTRLDVFQRLREKKPVVKTQGFGDGTKFKFSIAQNEILECDALSGKKRLLSNNVRLTTEEQCTGRVRLLVRGISQEEKRGNIKIEMAHLNDARPNISFPDWVTKSPNELFKWHAKKIVVSPVGEV